MTDSCFDGVQVVIESCNKRFISVAETVVSILDLIGRNIRITVADRLIMFSDLSLDVFKGLVNFALKRISLRFQIIGFLIP